ncbi:MAG TPA: Ku protein, partial [Candidatus Kapabacteria bacterium]
MPTAKRTAHKAKTSHPSWKGLMTFGLVSFPIDAFNALDRQASDIHFHQLHAKCHSRIHYKKVCPIHGEVSNDEIISGYEYKKGKYIEVEADELEALRTESDRALKIDAFISPETIDPLYFDGRMYYLLPSETASQEPYAVIARAMEDEERYGVGQLVMSGKDQLALVRPLEGVLHMAMLNFEAEIRPASTMAAKIKAPKNITKQLQLAKTLIENWTEDDLDFSKYHDTHRQRIEELIESKREGHEVTAP